MEFKFLVGPEIVEAEQYIPEDQRVSWPADSLVMYCFEDGKVIGRMGAYSLKIIEGTWASPKKRGTTFPARMMRQFETMYAAWLGNAIGAFAADEKVGGYLERVGYTKEPFTFYTKILKKDEVA